MNEWKWFCDEWIHECKWLVMMNEWINEIKKNESVSVMNEWKKMNERKWMEEWMKEWMKEWGKEWM